MLKKERHAYIIKQINLHNKVLSSDLSLQLKVSEDTVRRDLNELSEAGKILKVHGGALSKSFHFPFDQKKIYAQDSKTEIASKVSKTMWAGTTVLTGRGTTVVGIARMIPSDLGATCFTISPLVAVGLMDRKLLTVIPVGGVLSKNTQIYMAVKTVSDLSEVG